MTQLEREGLTSLRNLLLKQHKIVMEIEKRSFESLYGPVQSSSHLLNLLLSHDHFAWIREISMLVARIDETLDSKKPVPESTVPDLFVQIKKLLIADEEGEGFGRKYFDAIQDNPDAILIHAEMIKILRTL